MEPDDVLALLRPIALALPGAAEKLVVGHPAFFTRKVFAYCSMSYKAADGGIVRRPSTVCVLLPEDERRALLEQERVHSPMYIGPSGWIGINVDAGTDWQEIAELVEESYRHTASRRLVAQLDAG
jgi:predicted DNA-binding protein (MmcQ/YjbR family)